ncbi:MAG: Fe-S cluster assembly protein SufD [Bacteroidetes bacterium]|nr:Fe-S cluster assembly protein SufD [Bacteroidota bacterium]
MSLSTETKNTFELSLTNTFKDNKNGIFHSPHKKVNESRKAGIKYFEKIGLPTTKSNNWKSTNLHSVYEQKFDIGDDKPLFDKEINEIFHCNVHGFNTNVFALLNGWYYSSEETQLQILEDGIVVGSIIEAQKKYPEIFEKHFNEIAKTNNNGLSSVNAALFTDGLFIYVPDNVNSQKAVQLIKMVNRDISTMINTRNLIILGKNSSLSFLHCDDSINQHSGFLVTNTEVFLGENASLDLYKLQNLNNNTTLVNSTFIQQEKTSTLNVNVLTFNGGIIRNEFMVDLIGEGADANISGMYLMDDNQHVDNQVKVLHSAPNCTSSELFKGVLDDKASGVFNGYIYVARDAQKTVAFQKNANILMTSTASIDSMPFLEIYADDVKCSHGATVGQLDKDALFYLMQRGISENDAKLLLMYAFITEVTNKISIAALKDSIDDMVKKRLRGDLSICDKCVLHCSRPDIPVEFEIDMSKI